MSTSRTIVLSSSDGTALFLHGITSLESLRDDRIAEAIVRLTSEIRNLTMTCVVTCENRVVVCREALGKFVENECNKIGGRRHLPLVVKKTFSIF